MRYEREHVLAFSDPGAYKVHVNMDVWGAAQLPPNGLDDAEACIPTGWGPAADAENARSRIASRARDRARAAKHLTEREIAELLNVTVVGVHEMFECSQLAGAEHGGRVVYPRWQVTPDGALLPHLSAVVEAAEGVDAVSLHGVMEDSREELDGLTAVEGLCAGREVAPVLRALRERRWV